MCTWCLGGRSLMSPFFWMSMARRSRRRRMGRRWGMPFRRRRNRHIQSEPERRGRVEGGVLSWNGNSRDDVEHGESDSGTDRNSAHPNGAFVNMQRGLSILIEFLFGPDDQFLPSPTDEDKWKQRARLILDRNGSITLEELLPYVDSPPYSLKNTAEALLIVAHFNGIPTPASVTKRTFRFPVLMMEAEGGSDFDFAIPPPSTSILPHFTWEALLYGATDSATGPQPSAPPNPTVDGLDNGSNENPQSLPYLVEKPRVLTRLGKDAFFGCVAIGVCNFLGVAWLQSSLSSGTLGGLTSTSPLLSFAMNAIAFALKIYAYLFFALVIVRLAVILVANYLALRRNSRRAALAEQLLSQS